jgi:hypothetical protein
MVAAGLMKWRKRQALRDTSEDLGVQRQEQELRNMTPEEVDERVEAEVQPGTNVDAIGLVADVSAVKLRAVESAFYGKVRECLDSSHRLLVNQTLGTAEYDAILQELRSTDLDVVIEIKYIRQGFKYSWLRESAMRLALANELYQTRLKRHSVPLLLIIFSEDEASAQSEFHHLRAKVQSDLRQRGIGVRIEYVSEATIHKVSCEEIHRLVVG